MEERQKSRPTMTGGQKLVLSILLFLTILSVGFLIMLATGRMILP